MSSSFTESTVEHAALAWLDATGWRIAHGLDISPTGDTLTPSLSQREKKSHPEVVLAQRLRDVLLPKLISGELRVRDAERFSEERGL
jgi:hypothetical protein